MMLLALFQMERLKGQANRYKTQLEESVSVYPVGKKSVLQHATLCYEALGT